MDVSISSADEQAREAVINARDAKQAAKAERKKKREARQDKKRSVVITKRLRRRIEKEVLTDLLHEKRLYLSGEATGGEYVINTGIRYKRGNWRRKRDYVEGILAEVLAKHSGFEPKIDYSCDYDDWCNSIRIWYTLQNSEPTPS